MKRLKKIHYQIVSFSTFFSTVCISSFNDNLKPSTSSSVGKLTTTSSDVYIYDVGVVPVILIVAFAFFAYNKKSLQTVNKENVKEKPIKPLKQSSML